MKKTILLACLAAILLSGIAHAHPIGTKLWGHTMIVTPRPGGVELDYTIEVPVTKLAMMMNRFRSIHRLPRITAEDEAEFNAEMIDHLISGIQVDVDGRPASLEWNPLYVKRHGAGQVGFFNYDLHLIAALPEGKDGERIEIRNDNFPMQRALFHNAIASHTGAHATNEELPAHVGWSKDEASRRISFTFELGDAPAGKGGMSENAGLGHKRQSDTRLLELLRRTELGGNVLLVALLTAILLGAIHALSPGHGKALVAAYLVGSRGTFAHALWLGIIVTITHISSVVVLGIIGIALARFVVPEYYAPFISLASGLMIVGIGVWLFLRRYGFFHRHHHHDHHHHELESRGAPTRRQLLWLGISGGIVPCPSATVVMLTAIAIGRPAMGLVLIAAFSLGLALVLIALGMLSIRGRDLLARLDGRGLLARWLPLASAVIVTIVGVMIIYRGFWVEWVTWSW